MLIRASTTLFSHDVVVFVVVAILVFVVVSFRCCNKLLLMILLLLFVVIAIVLVYPLSPYIFYRLHVLMAVSLRTSPESQKIRKK